MQTWFISDTHFGHANIIKYCNRPYLSAEEMDEDMIRGWNAMVDEDDVVYHLGDVGWGSVVRTCATVSRLHGTKHLIPGNHDEDHLKDERFRALFKTISPLVEIRLLDPPAGRYHHITLCHYPMVSWNKSHHGSWQLYGHRHGTLPDDPRILRMDVGVDTHCYRPVSFWTVRDLMKQKTFVKEF